VLHEENVPDLRTKRGTMDGAWLATPTGLLVPNHSRINRARSTNIRQPNRILDWVNSLATVASVFVAVLSIIVAVLAQREQQAAETARRATEQAMLQQTRQQIALQARIAQLETRQIVLQEKIRAQNLDLTQRLLRSEVGQVATP
jgi:flagellar biosynthesis/type III secretory pathway M-ring protein FliF/YscJ